MFAPRWSTFSVLCLLILAVVLGFFGGKRFHGAGLGAPSIGLTESVAVSNSSEARTVNQEVDAQKLVAGTETLQELCRRLAAQPATPARNAALLDALEKLAEQDPQSAIALAKDEKNSRLRQQLLDAAFRGWGKTDARAAADWILSQPEGSLNANDAIAAVLKGAVQNPEAAIELTQELAQKNPGSARDYGDALIYALGENGNFQQAADFAASAAGGLREEWLAAAFGNWANYQPQAAATAAMQLTDADARSSALDAVISGWGQMDPQGLANFAMNSLPDGGQKNHALSESLVNWAVNDAEDAANWINSFGPSPALDSGEAAIATQQEVMKQPDVALQWAEQISDVNLRSRTLVAVIQTWALSDPSAARNFIQNSPDLLADDRANLLSQPGLQSN